MKTILYLLIVAVSLLTAEVKEIRKNIPVTNLKTIEMTGFNGSSLEIKTWNKKETSIEVSIEYTSSNKEQEQEYFKNVDIELKETGDRITIHYREPKIRNDEFSLKRFFNSLFSSYTSVKVTGVITVPAAANLISDMKYGTYFVEGVAGTLDLTGVSNNLSLKNCLAVQKVENNYGTTMIDHCGGALRLEGMSSKIAIMDFHGTVNGETNYSTITLSGIHSDASFLCSSGSLEIEDIGGNLTLNADYSKITANNIKGKVMIESQSATIRVKQASGVYILAPYSTIKIESVMGSGEQVYVKTSSGQIDIADVRRDVKIDDAYSKIRLSGIQGNVAVTGQSSSFHGRKITGNLLVNNEYAEIRIDELSASTVEITNKSSAIDIEMITKPTRVEILNQYGPVSVTLPDFSGDVSLKASYGSVITNLPLEVEEIGGGFIAMGKVGSGSGTMKIKTSSGNIEITKK